MRQIKFRAWDKANNMMIDMHAMEYFARTETRNQTRFELMQYTGLKDKNGKEIYEGDIVKIPDGRLHTIVWEHWGFCIKDPQSGIYNALSEYLEIIGNIYENQELLPVKE